MSIIEGKKTPPLSSVEHGQPFRFLSNSTTVFVRIDGLPDQGGQTPVVVVIDADQHEAQDSYTSPGKLCWCSPNTRVELLKLTKTPVYKVI